MAYANNLNTEAETKWPSFLADDISKCIFEMKTCEFRNKISLNYIP